MNYKGFGPVAVLLCAAVLAGCGEEKQEATKAPEAANAPVPMAPAAPAANETPGAPAAAPTDPATSGTAPAAPATPATPAPQQAAARTGEQVYNSSCQVCHAAGIAGAPKIGDKAAWAPRIKQGNDVLVQHAIAGFTGKTGVMPPRGTCMACSDQEIRNAVEYMVNKSK